MFLRSRRKAASDDADWIEAAAAIYELAGVAPVAKRRTWGTTSCHVTAEQRCLRASMSDS